MKIMAFDVSKAKTGWALWDDSQHYSAMRVGSFKSTGDSLFETVQSFHPQFVKAIRDNEPDYVGFEEALPNIPSFRTNSSDLGGEFQKLTVNAKSSLVLQRLIGDVQAVLIGLRVPHESVPVETWRHAFLGYGRKKGFQRADYKKAARAMCETMGIHVTNDDQAEACGLAFYLSRCSQHVKLIKHGVAA